MDSCTYLFWVVMAACSHFPTFGCLQDRNAVSGVIARRMGWREGAAEGGWAVINGRCKKVEREENAPSPCAGMFRLESRGEDMIGMT